MGQNYSQKRNMLLKIEQDLFWGGGKADNSMDRQTKMAA